jgi:hypothetical protein
MARLATEMRWCHARLNGAWNGESRAKASDQEQGMRERDRDRDAGEKDGERDRVT